ncbi:hypothetical protein K438DRAFT_1932148, partial [Mycena galopus ATCC 62051]
MAGNPNTLIVFGSSPDSYFVGHGRRYFAENIPEGFINHAKADLNISMTLWISMNKKLDTWVTHNVATGNFHFSGSTINQGLRDHLSGTNGKAAAEFVSFPDSTNSAEYFVKGKNSGSWNAYLDDDVAQKVKTTKAELPHFDEGLTGMLFGKGKTYILMFRGGFRVNFDENDISELDHPLVQVLVQHKDGWCIERNSTLCFYDSKYFFLKFKRTTSDEVQMHWNLPPNMGAKFRTLKDEAQQPEEKLALIQEDQKWVQIAQNRMNSEAQMNQMIMNQMQLNSQMFAAAMRGSRLT